MHNINFLRTSLSALVAAFDEVQVELSRASQDALDERLQTTAQNKTRHPHLSSTPLPEAMTRALATASRLEKKYAKTFQDATTGMLAIDQANQLLVRLNTAMELKKEQDRTKDLTGLYAEGQQFVDALFALEACKWHLAQQSNREMVIYADLLRWKAKDPNAEDPNNPWVQLNAAYEARKIRVEAFNKRGLSLPRTDMPASTGHVSVIPTIDDLQKVIAGWGVLAPTDVDHARAAGHGKVEGDGPYAGIIFAASYDPRVIPMWARQDQGGTDNVGLGWRDWYKLEVPSGPYALVQSAVDVPDNRNVFPPFGSLRLFGVNAEFSRADMQDLEDAAAGKGSMKTALKAVRHGVRDHTRAEDEDLVRFWLFLLIGRHFMDRIDDLFPHGYFHGVEVSDPGAVRAKAGSLSIIRIANDGNLSKCMRQLTSGPWALRL